MLKLDILVEYMLQLQILKKHVNTKISDKSNVNILCAQHSILEI